MMKGSDLLSINDLSRQDILSLFKETVRFKRKPYSSVLKGKTIIMLFAKPSTRTRVSFEVGINNLGGDDIFLPMDEIQLSRGESLEDTARVIDRYGDGIVTRLFKHDNLLRIAEATESPVINGLTDLLHPCQGLTDLFTIQEKFGSLKGKKLAFVGDGNNNVTHSLLHACSLLGVNISIGCPKGYPPNPQILENANKHALKTGSSVDVTPDPKIAARDADVLYTDTWVSMGEENQSRKRKKAFLPYQLNQKLLSYAKKNAIVMHDLPAHRGFEITNDVMDGPQSVIFDQAENRLHMEKAILSLIYKK